MKASEQILYVFFQDVDCYIHLLVHRQIDQENLLWGIVPFGLYNALNAY